MRDLDGDAAVRHAQVLLQDPECPVRNIGSLDPELRIVDQELWDRVKARQQGLRRNQAFHEKQRPRMLLSFLLKCGVCGGGFSKVSEKHYGCSAARNKGTCDNRLTVRQDELEGLVIAALQERLMDPALCEEFYAEYTAHLNRIRGAKNASRAAAKAELGKLTREKERLIRAIKDGVPASEIKDDLARIAARREELEALIEGTTEEPVLLHPKWRRTTGPRSRTSRRH